MAAQDVIAKYFKFDIDITKRNIEIVNNLNECIKITQISTKSICKNGASIDSTIRTMGISQNQKHEEMWYIGIKCL